MRKVEILQYTCPNCNGDLIPDGVNFSFGNPGEEQTKQHYRCSGCSEQFYSIEEAHVLPAEKTPEFTCFYCGKQCTYLSLKDDWTDYWKCLPCKVSYSQFYDPTWKSSPTQKGVNTISLFTTINNKMYVLRQFLDKGTSRVEMIPEDEEDTVVIVYEFKFLLSSVTPSNIHIKLPVYMLFS